MFSLRSLFGKKSQPIVDNTPAANPHERLLSLMSWHYARAEHYRATYDATRDMRSYSYYMHSIMAVARINQQLASVPAQQQLSLF